MQGSLGREEMEEIVIKESFVLTHSAKEELDERKERDVLSVSEEWMIE